MRLLGMSSDTPAPSWRFLLRAERPGWQPLTVLTSRHAGPGGVGVPRRRVRELPELGVHLRVAYFRHLRDRLWAKMIKDSSAARPGPEPGRCGAARGPGGAVPATGGAAAAGAAGEADDEEPAADNADPARLTAEASRHGKWHGLC